MSFVERLSSLVVLDVLMYREISFKSNWTLSSFLCKFVEMSIICVRISKVPSQRFTI